MRIYKLTLMMKLNESLFILVLIILCTYRVCAQISPGELSRSHAYLEGVKNCRKCHTVGSKVSSDKCLECHVEIKKSIASKKGFHASAKVGQNECFICHNEHHGFDYKLNKLNKKLLDHTKMGFELKGIHAKKECKECHKTVFISDTGLKKKTSTYMGLSSACLNCHSDYHQGKLSSNCTTCHNFNSFKIAKVIDFNHNKKEFPLLGRHKNVSCIKCHKTEIIDGKRTQRFKELHFENCTPCHKDIHENKFGNNCKQCHSTDSFHAIKKINTFNHDKTAFELIGKHKTVACKSCHKTEFMTDPVKHDKCNSCHADYHKGEFGKNGISPDCNTCHTNNDFTRSTFTIERHNKLKFRLEGSHKATPCMACHQKKNNWSFSQLPTKCIHCHTNIHNGFIEEQFMENENCSACHDVNSWETIKFDHEKTGYILEGVHSRQTCAACHLKMDSNGKKIQKFEGLSRECSTCHKDSHMRQFDVNCKTECKRCHGFANWKDFKFDHKTSRFKLDGAHLKIECVQCHKQIIDEKNTYIKYKFKDVECTACH